MCKIRIELTDGRKMDLELYKDIAPKTVDNFLKLIDEKFFDGLCFHRVIEDFMIQGGGFTFDGKLIPKNAKETIKGEFHANGFPNDLKHTAGVISMARTMFPNSASSQFFICVTDTPHLDGQYAGFGKTIDEESTQVAIDISKVPTTFVGGYDDVPVTPIVIKTISRIEY